MIRRVNFLLEVKKCLTHIYIKGLYKKECVVEGKQAGNQLLGMTNCHISVFTFKDNDTNDP